MFCNKYNEIALLMGHPGNRYPYLLYNEDVIIYIENPN